MPNRILKESICLSESLLGLSWFEEVFFYRLLVTCDDYGCYYAREKVLKGRLFPLNDVPLTDIHRALQSLCQHKLIRLYSHDGQPYLQITAWHKHQRMRSKRSKFPMPDDINLAPEDDPPDQQPVIHNANAALMPCDNRHGDFLCPDLSVGGHLPAIDSHCPPESESETESETESESQSGTETESETGTESESQSGTKSRTKEIISFLNQTCGTHFTETSSVCALIHARQQEGFGLQDFQTVITKKHAQWADNPVMVSYLRPETLFSAKHFASYLHEPSVSSLLPAKKVRSAAHKHIRAPANQQKPAPHKQHALRRLSSWDTLAAENGDKEVP